MTHDELANSLKARQFFGLSPSQWKLTSALMMRDQLQLSQIYPILWPNPDDEPQKPAELIRAQMHRARERMRDKDLTIKLVWGRGYYMSKEDRAKAIELAKKAMEQ